jgi:gamma-glutamyltranspeptidase/glutathione hydrolase
MSPTLVLRDGKVTMVVGSPGGSRIITITLEVLLNLIDYGMEPQEAVNATRLHHQWLPDVIAAEPYALSADTVQVLQSRGYTIVEQSPWGAAELIVIPQVSSGTDRPSSGSDSALGGRLRAGMMYGASDDRRAAGSAAGY